MAKEELIGICGLICSDCGAFIATQADDENLRQETAENWSMMYNADIKAAEINCDGCISSGNTHFSFCSKCEIRACGIERGVVNCAHCDQYACEKLEGFFGHASEARAVLDEIRRGLTQRPS